MIRTGLSTTGAAARRARAPSGELTREWPGWTTRPTGNRAASCPADLVRPVRTDPHGGSTGPTRGQARSRWPRSRHGWYVRKGTDSAAGRATNPRAGGAHREPGSRHGLGGPAVAGRGVLRRHLHGGRGRAPGLDDADGRGVASTGDATAVCEPAAAAAVRPVVTVAGVRVADRAAGPLRRDALRRTLRAAVGRDGDDGRRRAHLGARPAARVRRRTGRLDGGPALRATRCALLRRQFRSGPESDLKLGGSSTRACRTRWSTSLSSTCPAAARAIPDLFDPERGVVGEYDGVRSQGLATVTDATSLASSGFASTGWSTSRSLAATCETPSSWSSGSAPPDGVRRRSPRGSGAGRSSRRRGGPNSRLFMSG